MVNSMRVAPPWVLMYRLYKAMFGSDSEITLEFNDDSDDPAIKMYVGNEEKADALAKLLPPTIDMGNVTMTIAVIPPNQDELDRKELFKKAFEGNPVFLDSVVVEEFGGRFLYNTFKKEVVQYAADDIGDLFGVASTLYEDIAREIFGDMPGVFYCTDVDKEPII